jgi:hypothetical protein
VNVQNIHRRRVGSASRLGALLDGLASGSDLLWPGDRWPPLRLDRGLVVGARGGHGPIRYRVERYEPGQRVRFRFERPRGFVGYHEFRVVGGKDRSAELVHILEARMRGTARITWPLVFRPLHDALIEDALDNAEREASGQPTGSRPWSRYVRGLRWAFARASVATRLTGSPGRPRARD